LVNWAVKAVITAISSIGTAAKAYVIKFEGSLSIHSLKFPPMRLAITDMMKVPSKRHIILKPIARIFET
jgi:hypothetical protein